MRAQRIVVVGAGLAGLTAAHELAAAGAAVTLAETRARLLLGHEVKAIVQAADRVVVRVVDDAGLQQEIECDAVVLAVPATTLRDVDITPALGEDQQKIHSRAAATHMPIPRSIPPGSRFFRAAPAESSSPANTRAPTSRVIWKVRWNRGSGRRLR